ncbi:MAG: hypothetical protein ABFD85_17455 [Phycisphaerae bacterium]
MRWALVIMVLVCAAAGVAAPAGKKPRALPALPVRFELVSDQVDVATIHGWNTCRLLKLDGALYASGLAARAEDDKTDNWAAQKGIVFRRSDDGKWRRIAGGLPRIYTWAAGAEGTVWAVAPSWYTNTHTYRSGKGPDFSAGAFKKVYDGTCSYEGVGASPEGNFLLLHAKSSNMKAGTANAIVAAFWEQAAGKWHYSELPTPEGRYGYAGVIVRGNKALAVLQSSMEDPAANPEPPHYSWRHVRLARCDDLTKGVWVSRRWLAPAYGATSLYDLVAAPDGCAYLSYLHAGADTREALAKTPARHYIARIHDDLSTEVFATGLQLDAARLVLDSKGGWHIVARPALGGNLHLWTLDAATGFTAVKEYDLPGTESLKGYVLHTLNPGRFGGQDDGDTIHIMSTNILRAPEGGKLNRAELWHAYFKLPS